MLLAACKCPHVHRLVFRAVAQFLVLSSWRYRRICWWCSSPTSNVQTGVRCLHEASHRDCADCRWGCASGLRPALRISRRLLGPLRISVPRGFRRFRSEQICRLSPLYRQQISQHSPRLPKRRCQQFQRSSSLHRGLALSQAIPVAFQSGDSLRGCAMDGVGKPLFSGIPG